MERWWPDRVGFEILLKDLGRSALATEPEAEGAPHSMTFESPVGKVWRRGAALVLVLLALFLERGSAGAQVSVVQGRESTADSYQRLASPMVLKVKANNLRGVRNSKGLGFGNLSKFLCEDVSIATFAALVSEGSDGGRTYTVKGSLRVHSGVDQNVGLTLSLFEGTSRILMVLEDPKISAESGEDERFTMRTTVPAKTAKAIDEAKDLTLEIIFRVKRD